VAERLKEGPLPAHYEPLESPVANTALRTADQSRAPIGRRVRDNPYADSPGDPRYPHVLTTYRLTEHHTAGGMSRTLSHLAELQPEAVLRDLARAGDDDRVRNGDRVQSTTPRGSIVTRALVTGRVRPLVVQGRTFTRSGCRGTGGYRGVSTGPIANDLVAISEEPNVKHHGSQGARLQNRPMVTAFLTDTTLCIGCKACEVACKEWNEVPSDGFAFTGFSYDNTPGSATRRGVTSSSSSGCSMAPPANLGVPEPAFRWDFSSDVCKHCEHAGCLEACPTGSIVRTEFGGVFIQPTCATAAATASSTCPFGVVDRRPMTVRAFKCTFCYDRQKAGLKPACATACPTESIRVRRDSRAAHTRARTRGRAARTRD
jgi:Fe-S-cluster-containing dehydrogenase component